MKLLEVSEDSYFEPPPELHLGLSVRGSFKYFESLN